MDNLDDCIEEIKRGRARIIGGPVTDQSWSVTFESGRFMKRGVYIYEEYEEEITEDQVRSILKMFGEKVLKRTKQD